MTGVDPYRTSYEVLLEGEQVYNALLGLSVSTEINRIPRARLELNYRQVEKNEGSEDDLYKIDNADGFDPRPKNVKNDFLPGKEIEIKLGRGGEVETVFIGYITKQNVVAQNDGGMFLYIECKHKSNKMTLHKRTRFHHHDANQSGSADQDIDKVSDEDVLKKVVEHYQSEQLQLAIEDTRLIDQEHENMTQYDCSDWDFMVIRAEALGYVCLPEEDEIRLLIPELQPTASYTIELGKNLMEYEAEYDETVQSEVSHIAGWDIDKQERSYENLKNGTIAEGAEKVQSERTMNYPVDLERSESEKWLANEVNRQQFGKIRGLARVKGTAEIKVADTVEISGFQSVWDREAYVSGIKHTLVDGLWHTYVQCGIDHTPHAEKYGIHAQESSPFVPKTSGLLYGKVVQYKNGDGGYELIEVEVAAYSNEETTQSIYARLANVSAGANGGTVFRPYPGDEVVIGFIHDDPRFPVILGAMYNSENAPPYELDEDTQNEIGFQFNDWKMSIHAEDEVMTIASPGGQQFTLDDSESSILMAFDDSNSIKITSDGIEMEASKISLKGTNGIEMEGMTIEAKADTSMSLEGGTQLELEGKVTASLKGQITQIN